MSTDHQFVLPETYTRRQLNDLYRAISLKLTVSRTLRKYFNAFANLYGIMPLRKAWEIISTQSPTLVTKKEFLAFAKIAMHENENYYVVRDHQLFRNFTAKTAWDSTIVDESLFDGSGIVQELYESQSGKPYYIPEKEELLSYEDPYYYEETAETQALKTFLAKTFSLDDEKVEIIFLQFLFDTRYRFKNMTDAVQFLQEVGLEFQSITNVDKFAKLYQQFNNNTRMQCNRGYTPSELSRIMPRSKEVQSISIGPNIRKSLANGDMDIEDFRRQILTMDFPNEALRIDLLKQLAEIKPPVTQSTADQPKKAVGRNDPCPCGSGKKYKNCCGRGK